MGDVGLGDVFMATGRVPEGREQAPFASSAPKSACVHARSAPLVCAASASVCPIKAANLGSMGGTLK